MIKKILFTLIAVFGITSAANAYDTYVHDGSVLPQKAQATIANNFKADVSVVKLDKTLGYINDYEVILTDGTEIKFDHKGNWDNVEVNINKSVPSTFVITPIANYVKKHQPDQRIVGIDKDRDGYEVVLANGRELKFNEVGQYIRHED